ncbi:hypothetical protein [Derxia lacustris]|uniref:hypothetical protein n=1 Tax=Derxia lacustris TaxID=764842 RepID=UPI00159332BA|nr:hypothetical protein [Derxia lacustris]
MSQDERMAIEQVLARLAALDARQGPISHVDIAPILAELRELVEPVARVRLA